MTEMTYSESAAGVLITTARAHKELRDHSIPLADWTEGLAESFVSDGVYSASALLEWLGY
jgi:hypothetical protein